MGGVKRFDVLMQLTDAKATTAECVLASDYDTIITAHQRLEGEVKTMRELLAAWRRMFDGGIASGELGVLRGQTDAALRGNEVTK